jgi:hypothetical protein
VAKIYPDTNRFVDFYRATHDNLDVFKALQGYKGSLVLTEQTITEFRRNRVRTLNWLVTEFAKTLKVGPYTTAVIQALPGFKDLTTWSDAYKKKGKEVLEQLKQFSTNEKKDPVAQQVLALAADPAVTYLKLSDQAIKRAHRRKLLGNPPCSPDKYTIGDEVIWELLIENLKEDLIIVTRDNTFHDNLPLLSEEYQQQTGQTLLLVTKTFSEALETIGQTPTQELIEAEKKEQESLPPLGWLFSNSMDAANTVVQEIYRRRRADAAWLAAQSNLSAPTTGGFSPPEPPQ